MLPIVNGIVSFDILNTKNSFLELPLQSNEYVFVSS
jgi:hypothetical protein